MTHIYCAIRSLKSKSTWKTAPRRNDTIFEDDLSCLPTKNC